MFVFGQSKGQVQTIQYQYQRPTCCISFCFPDCGIYVVAAHTVACVANNPEKELLAIVHFNLVCLLHVTAGTCVRRPRSPTCLCNSGLSRETEPRWTGR